ncbi:MAG: transposase [Mycolicibacterium sp.]|nr:transposase [Mycolicibacterium sp.]
MTSVLDTEEHIAVKVAHVIYQKIIAAYADPNRRRGKKAMTKLIDSIRRGVAAGLEEIAQLGRTLWRRRHDILAFFDHHASNGPPEAINGPAALGRNALGFRNLTHYRWRSLLHSGRAPLTRQCTVDYEEPVNPHLRTGRPRTPEPGARIRARPQTASSRSKKSR